MDNQTKEIIVNRLYEKAGICGHCGERRCPDAGYRKLPDTLNTDDVLQAINLDEHYYKDNGGCYE